MKLSKCKKCNHIQDFDLLNCQKCGEEMPKVAFEGKNPEKSKENEKAETHKKASPMIKWLAAISTFIALVIIMSIVAVILFGGPDDVPFLMKIIMFGIIPASTTSFVYKKYKN